MRPRNSDGTTRHSNRPRLLTHRSIIARWIEAETLHLKQLGMSFREIAEHIIRVAQSGEKAVTEVPQEVPLPNRISLQAVHRAFQRAIARLPKLEAEAFRQVDNARSEAMLLNLQPAIRNRDTRAIDTAVRILDHQAKINGYVAAQKHELVGKGGAPLKVEVNGPRPMTQEQRRQRALEVVKLMRELGLTPGVDDEPEEQ